MTKIPASSLPGIYALLMEEVKERHVAVTKTLAAAHNTDPPYHYLEIEFCYLQIRRMCEALAMAVLVAHNEIDEARAPKRFMKVWNADTLFEALSRLNDRAFPRAASIAPGDEEGVLVATLASEGLTREGFRKIYSACSEGLHAGSLKRMLDHGPKRYSVKDVISWLNEIVALLNVHVVVLPSGKMMTVEMTGGENDAAICHMDVIEP